jgi:hypothetical protein
MSGYPLNQLNVNYYGTDPHLSENHQLTLREVKPILRKWGY